MSKWPEWLPRVLVESALIVFSVLLALAVDQWREGRSHRQEAATAEVEIVDELRANHTLVQEALRYHSSLLEGIEGQGDGSSMPSVRLFSRGFVAPAQLSSTAWASAAETGTLSHMDYSTVLRLSRVYAQQDRYAEQSRGIGQLIYSEIYHGGTDAVVENHRNLAGIIRTFQYREGQLLQLYDQTLAAR